MVFDKAPQVINDLTKIETLSQIKGVYQLESFPDFQDNEKFNNNDFSQYTEPKLGSKEEDTLLYLSKALMSSEFLEIEKKSDSYYFKNFNLLNENIYNQFFKNKIRTIKIDDNTSIVIKSKIIKDSIHIAISSNDNQFNESAKLFANMQTGKEKKTFDTTLKIQKIGKLFRVTSLKNSFPLDSITILQKSDSKFYAAIADNNLFLVKKDNANYEIMRTEVKEEGFNLFLFNYVSEERLTNEHKLSFDSLMLHENFGQRTMVYSEKLISKLIGSPFESIFLKGIKIKNFPSDKTDEGKSFLLIAFIIGLLTILIIFLFYIRHRFFSINFLKK
jgi:hypothetical protein